MNVKLTMQTLFLGVVALLAASTSALSAQSHASSLAPRVSVEGAGMYVTVSGDDFRGVHAGMGLDVQGRVAVSVLSLGVGYQHTSHDIDVLTNNVVVNGVFLEPRLTIPAAPGVAPYVAGRFALVTQHLKIGISSPLSSADERVSHGITVGVGGGVGLALSRAVALDAAAIYNRVRFGTVVLDGEPLPDSDTSGSGVMFRLGLGVSFGRR
jgi:opacity protein-like surface antigen